MSTLVGTAYHPVNGSTEEIYEGFSWHCLLFGGFWYIYKGLWGWGLIALILAIATMGLSWLVFPFFANGQYASSLRRQGYLTKDQWEMQRSGAPSNASPSAMSNGVADELTKFADLHAKGILSDEEFAVQKSRLLS